MLLVGKYQDPKVTVSRKTFGIIITKHTDSTSQTLIFGPAQKWHPQKHFWRFSLQKTECQV